jgi:hypothetical protein
MPIHGTTKTIRAVLQPKPRPLPEGRFKRTDGSCVLCGRHRAALGVIQEGLVVLYGDRGAAPG